MERTLKILLILMMGLNLCACSSNDEKADEESDTSNVVEQEEVEETTNDEAEETITLLDNNDCYIEYRGIDEYSASSWIVDLYVENKSNEDLYISLREGLANECNIEFANNSNSVSAESKYLASANYDYIIHTDDLAEYGIDVLENIEFNLKVSESLSGDAIYETPVNLTLSKTVVSEKESVDKGKGEILLNSDNIYIESYGLDEYSSSRYIMNIYAENNTEDEFCISLQNFLINGYSIKVSNNAFTSILPNSKYLSIPLYDYVIDADDLEAYDITTIETITFDLQIKTSLFGDVIQEKSVTLKPNITL